MDAVTIGSNLFVPVTAGAIHGSDSTGMREIGGIKSNVTGDAFECAMRRSLERRAVDVKRNLTPFS